MAQSLADVLMRNKVSPERAASICKRFPDAEVLDAGRHSIILKHGRLAVKVQKDISAARTAIADEARWLGFFNSHGIGPRIVEHNVGLQYVIYTYVPGDFLPEFIARCKSKAVIRKVLIKCILDCRTMDDLGINKKEMHRPLKHIVVGRTVTFIDFERCFRTKNPKNVTQFCNFILLSDNPVAAKVRKLFSIRRQDAMRIVRAYKRQPEICSILSLIR